MWQKQKLMSVVFLLISMLGAGLVTAQDAGIITLDQNQTGTLTQAAPVASFTFETSSAITIRTRVFAITAGFAPALRIIDESGMVLQTNENTENNTAVEIAAAPLNVGAYRFEVFSANGEVGDFLLNVQAVSDARASTALNVGEAVSGEVSASQSRQLFSFRASAADALVIAFQSDLLPAPVVTLRDADTGESLAVKSARVRGVRYEIAQGQENYLLEVVHSGASVPENFQVCLAQISAVDACGLSGGASSASAALDVNLSPVYGDANLAANFAPDPFGLEVTGGGEVNANYLGASCAGNMTAAPTFSINYTGDSAALLRFYFLSADDTTMAIHAPEIGFLCGDDSYGTLNPTINIDNPIAGRYDVWIGTYAAGESITGMLHLTSLDANHP